MVLLMLTLPALAVTAPQMIPLDVFRAAQQADVDQVAAQTEIPMLDGGTFTLAGHRGQPVILTFWASWCGPCQRELPALAAWSKSHPHVSIVAVNVDKERSPAEHFLKAVHVELPVGFDPDAQRLGRFGVTAMPTMFLFDSTGALAWQHAGYSTEKGFDELDQALSEVK